MALFLPFAARPMFTLRAIPPLILVPALLSWAVAAPPAPGKRADRARELSALMERARAQHTAAPIDEYLKRTAAERDPVLYKTGIGALLKQKVPMTRAQRRELVRLIREPGRGLLPQRLPVPRKGPIEVRYSVGAQFFDEEVQLLANEGFNVTDGPDGLNAQRGRVHVVIRSGHDKVLRDLKDPKVHLVIYSGHSELGGVVERGLQQADLGEMRGTKLVAMLSCNGTQTLPLLAARLPKAHLLSTLGYSHSGPDREVIKALLSGLDKRRSYAQIRQGLLRNGVENNYLFPDRVAHLEHVDYDGNGRLDAPQWQGGGVALAALGRRERAAAQRMLSGVHYVRTMNTYYSEEERSAVFTRAQASVPVVPVGIEPGDGKSVVHVRERNDSGKRSFEVALDEHFAKAPKELVGAATVFELELALQRSLLEGQGAESGERQRLRALAFTGDYIRRMFPAARGEKALARLGKLKGFPASVTLWRMPSGVHDLSEFSLDRLGQALGMSQ